MKKNPNAPFQESRFSSGGFRGSAWAASTLLSLALVLSPHAEAATNSWIASAAGTYNFTNTTYWAGGLLPGTADTALFTNTLQGSSISILWSVPVNNDAVSFDYQNSGTYKTMTLTNTDWLVTSRLVIAPSVNARTNVVILRNGTLSVTNASRTAVFEVGSGLGRAVFDLAGGTLNVDSFVVTNVGVGLNQINGGVLVGGKLNTFASSMLILTNGGINPNLELKNGVAWNMLGGSNLIRVAAARSFLVESASVFRVSGAATFLDSSVIGVGYTWYDQGSAVWVQDGAIAQLTGLSVGTNASGFGGSGVSGRGLVVVTNGGVLRVNQISTGLLGFGTVSVSAATLQFTTNTPFVETKTAQTIVLSGGTLSFLGVTNAAVNGAITNIAYSGANTLQLNSATNAILSSYAFSNGAAFSTLDLAGSSSLWRSTNLTLGIGGKITGTGSILANVASNSGTISPGNSPGLLTFSSNLTLLSSSVLNMEIAGTNLSLFDRIAVNGTFALGGTLNVLTNGYAPQAGDSFQIFNFNPSMLSGTFSVTNFGSLGAGLAWDADNLYTTGILGVIATIPEPSVLAAALAGLGLLAFLRRRTGS